MNSGQEHGVRIRRFPAPFRAALAICSDLDETPDRQTYWEIVRFLNSRKTTAMGAGVGLEVGNSIYFDMPQNQFAYWTTDDTGRRMIRALIQSGHIDVLHSYGDLAKSRMDAHRTLDELRRHDCWLRVWVDHSKAPSNFGPDIMCGRGDARGAAAYHADITLEYGIQFVWRGRTTGMIGQDVPLGIRSAMHMLHRPHPFASCRVLTKELVKIGLGACGRRRWRMYAENRACRPARLRDGQPIWEFLRSNPYWHGSGRGDTADGIADVLTDRMLDRLLECEGVCILYTHLGKVRDPRTPFGPGTVAAFARLARRCEEGGLLVTTTHRLLRYLTTRDRVRYSVTRGESGLRVRILSIDDPVSGDRAPTPDDLMGLTFSAAPAESIELGIAEEPPLVRAGRTGGKSTVAAFPWVPLTLPEL